MFVDVYVVGNVSLYFICDVINKIHMLWLFVVIVCCDTRVVDRFRPAQRQHIRLHDEASG